MTERKPGGSRPPRGRPPAKEAGQVEERILETATDMFLSEGFGRTTLDAVSKVSGTGKSAVYNRYPDKEALFTAVVHRSIDAMFSALGGTPGHATAQERLRAAGIALAENLLLPRCIALMRMTAAEAETFPNLAETAYRASFDGSVRHVAAAVSDGNVMKNAERVAERFVELALQPLSFQAIFGRDPDELRGRIASDVDDAIRLLDAKGLLSE